MPIKSFKSQLHFYLIFFSYTCRTELVVPAQNWYVQHTLNITTWICLGPLYGHIYIHTYAYIYLWSTHNCTHVYTRMYIHTHIHVLTPTHVSRHMHTHIAKSVHHYTSVNSVTSDMRAPLGCMWSTNYFSVAHDRTIFMTYIFLKFVYLSLTPDHLSP